ncbi:hypothetical protein WA026_012182 [Henosepilachna vigintioctopunctata]|uniref:Uncharacterized protein n=1 Tax=Henosepilachna vigintioctopunctata TaxID=420089 RepID=A0AAW1VEC7_9CUCU
MNEFCHFRDVQISVSSGSYSRRDVFVTCRCSTTNSTLSRLKPTKKSDDKSEQHKVYSMFLFPQTKDKQEKALLTRRTGATDRLSEAKKGETEFRILNIVLSRLLLLLDMFSMSLQMLDCSLNLEKDGVDFLRERCYFIVAFNLYLLRHVYEK